MANYYWLKLWYEMLDDLKIGQLRPALRWRFVECCLVAGERREDGYLPPIPEYAWRVRDSAENVETDFVQLADCGLLSQNEGRWLVTNFKKRQEKVDDADRKRAQRERERKQQYYGTSDDTSKSPSGHEPVTNRDTDTDTDTDKIRSDTDLDALPRKNRKLPALPVHLNCNPLLNAWGEWIQYHVDRGHPLTTTTALKQFKMFDDWGNEQSAAAIENSIANNYTALVLPKRSNNGEIEPAGFAAVRSIQEEVQHGDT